MCFLPFSIIFFVYCEFFQIHGSKFKPDPIFNCCQASVRSITHSMLFFRVGKYSFYGDALDKYYHLGKNLNQRDTIAVRKMVGGFIKLLYPDGDFTKDQLEEILKLSLEMRRRVKEQLKKLGGMEFYDVNFSYIDNDSFEEHFVSVPEQGGGKLIPEGMCNPGQVYTVGRGKSGMVGVFRLESQMLTGNGKFERTGIGSDREAKEASNTALPNGKLRLRRRFLLC